MTTPATWNPSLEQIRQAKELLGADVSRDRPALIMQVAGALKAATDQGFTQERERAARVVEMTIVSKSYEILICEGVSGLCIYLNDYRIAGRKPLGGGKTIARWTVTATDLARAVPAKWPFVPLASTPEMRDRVRELATPARDDFDRAILIVLDDFDRLQHAIPAGRAALSEKGKKG